MRVHLIYNSILFLDDGWFLQDNSAPKPLPQPPQQRSKRIIIQQQEELFSLQEHPPPQFVADKSLIGLPPKFHLHCYPMQGGLGDLHKKMKKKTEIFYLHIDREYTIILTAL